MFSSDENHFATCSEDGSVRVWSVPSNELVVQFQVLNQVRGYIQEIFSINRWVRSCRTQGISHWISAVNRIGEIRETFFYILRDSYNTIKLMVCLLVFLLHSKLNYCDQMRLFIPLSF